MTHHILLTGLGLVYFGALALLLRASYNIADNALPGNKPEPWESAVQEANK